MILEFFLDFYKSLKLINSFYIILFRKFYLINKMKKLLCLSQNHNFKIKLEILIIYI